MSITATKTNTTKFSLPGSFENLKKTSGMGDTLLMDLGTTTVALVLIDKKSGSLRQTTVFENPQKRYSADVMSRIRLATNGHGNRLKECILSTLKDAALSLCSQNQQPLSSITHCYIGGNTTMIHLLLGLDCKPLAASPFTLVADSPKPFFYNSCEIHILPWISAFVGGDITAGMLACRMSHYNSCLLLDLGTNGELLLHHNNHWYATSTAAGPAFEGNAISCGCSSLPGAIEKIELKRLFPSLTTIENKLPVGICGSGVISLCAELIRKGYVSRDGILTDSFLAEGIFLGKTPKGTPLIFTPKDFRSLQPAIAAVAAGIETLCQEASVALPKIEQIFLAGAFGFHIELADCETLGIFPAETQLPIKVIGNTCLMGLYSYATKYSDTTKELLLPDLPCITHVELADNSYFKESFIRHMTYPA